MPIRTSLTLLVLVGLCLLALNANAQPRGMQRGDVANVPPVTVSGKVLDSLSSEPLVSVTVVFRNLRDTTIRTGAFTDKAGGYEIENLRPGRYRRVVTYVGYDRRVDTIAIRPSQGILDLGVVKLLPGTAKTGDVVVAADKPMIQLGVDKKIFNVAENAIAEGGNATDVLRQIPTLDVNMDGAISLRGSSNLVVLINGRPSGLTGANRQAVLDNIPANSIDKVEIITNPSAKYDPEGMTGILNIVLKKNTLDGLNGTASIGTSSNRSLNGINKYNASGTLGWKNGALNSILTYGFNWNDRAVNGFNNRDNFLPGLPRNSIDQVFSSGRRRGNNLINLSTDYSLSQKSTLTFTGNVSVSTTDEDERVDYTFLDANRVLTGVSQRFTDGRGVDNNYEAGLFYKHLFELPGHDIQISTNYSRNIDEDLDDFTQFGVPVLGLVDSLPLLQSTRENGAFQTIVSNIDYERPTDLGKFEAGGRHTARRLNSDFFGDSLDRSIGTRVVDRRLTNDFRYSEDVYAVYGIFGSSWGSLSYTVGLRFEQTEINAFQVVENQSIGFSYGYFFPSGTIGWKFNEEEQIQFSYTRRINRPGFRSLNPFADQSDPLNIRTGNPRLLPETGNSYEVTWLKNAGVHTITSSVFLRQTFDVIQRIRSVQPDGVSIVTFQNVSEARNYGMEFVYRASFGQSGAITANLNAFRNEILGAIGDAELNVNNHAFNLRLNGNYKLTDYFSLQGSYMYNSPMLLPQGEMRPFFGGDLGLRWEQSAAMSWNFNVSDVFDNRQMGFLTAGEGFSGEVLRKMETRILTLNMTWRFGSGQAERQQQRRMRDEGGGMDMGL